MSEIKNKIQDFQPKIAQIQSEISKKIVGQSEMIRDMLIALFSWGHILIEWAPGLAKTLSVDTLSKTLQLQFQRIQFTPDLLPSDLVGANIYNPAKNDFFVRFWPIFSNFVLADEINRAPSKVQSALLEAMAEKQVTIGDKTYKLDLPFMVLATQNPLEQEGTFSLPEAQLDRFLLKTIVDYPSFEEEVQIMKQSLIRDESTINSVMNISEIQEIQDVIKEIYVDDKIFDYITRIVFFTRESTNKHMNYLNYPVSPRASLALLKSAKAQAFLSNRDFVIPEDVKMMAYPVLRHRISLNYEAYADEVKTDDIIQTILENVEVL